MHILVSPKISVSEGHYIAQHVHQSLIIHFDRIKDVTVHVDPEDDELSCPSFHLPNRNIIEQTLLKPWQQDYADIQYWVLHYLNGALSIDLVLRGKTNQINALEQRIKEDLSKQSDIKICILFDHYGMITHD